MTKSSQSDTEIEIIISVDERLSSYSSVYTANALEKYINQNDQISYGDSIQDYIHNGIKGASVKDHEALIKKIVVKYLDHCDGLVIPGNNDDINHVFYSGNEKRIRKTDLNDSSNRRNKIELALVMEAFARGIMLHWGERLKM
jgi:gamma-glutamyl-gamma-aminobutyrate hydrolase PuuD